MPNAMPGPVGADTRLSLILAGERLFGEQGIDAVSLRQINSAAGQRNSSAAHYHFGSREALVTAIYDYRMQRVNQRRVTMLERLEHSASVRAVVETIILPIVEEIRESENGHHYIRFLAQVVGHPRIQLEDIWSSPHGTGLAEALARLRRVLPEIPGLVVGQRFGLMWEQAIHALADREQLSDNNGGEDIGAALFVSNLIDMVAGGLAAPVSPGTRAELKAQGEDNPLAAD
jgi:AcrR family transcriptional regulator